MKSQHITVHVGGCQLRWPTGLIPKVLIRISKASPLLNFQARCGNKNTFTVEQFILLLFTSVISDNIYADISAISHNQNISAEDVNAGSYNSSKLIVHLWLLWPSSHFTSSISHSPSSVITAITYFKSLKLSSLCPQESMDSLHKRLERSRQMQTVLRAFEARDRNLLEDNLWRVSFWSCASVLVMLCVALTQVNWALNTAQSVDSRAKRLRSEFIY